MKTYKVQVRFNDAEPTDSGTRTETYTIEALDEFHAERLAMEKCATEFWSYEPMEALAEEMIQEQEKAA